jgi:hypothetical protein
MNGKEMKNVVASVLAGLPASQHDAVTKPKFNQW